MTHSKKKIKKWSKPNTYLQRELFKWFVCESCGHEFSTSNFCPRCLSEAVREIEFVK